jgi:hypothetical protein
VIYIDLKGPAKISRPNGMQPLYQAVEFQRSKARGRTYTGAIERFCKHFLERVSLTKSQSLVGVAGSKGSGFDNPWKGEVVVSQRLSACVLEYWSIGRKETTGNR